jgi:hypothetical protein
MMMPVSTEGHAASFATHYTHLFKFGGFSIGQIIKVALRFGSIVLAKPFTFTAGPCPVIASSQ